MQPATPLQAHSLRMSEGYVTKALDESFKEMFINLDKEPEIIISAPNLIHKDYKIEEYEDEPLHYVFSEGCDTLDIRVSRKQIEPPQLSPDAQEILYWFPQPHLHVHNVLDAPYCKSCRKIKPHINMRNEDICKECSHRSCKSANLLPHNHTR